MKRMVICKEDGILYFIAIAVSTFNIVFYENALISYIVALIQSFWLLYLVFKKQFVKYICYYMIFISTSLEFSVFVNGGVIYSLKEIRFLGVNMGIWLFMPILVMYLIEIRYINKNRCKYTLFTKSTNYFLGMNVAAMIVGIICILVNDNNIRNVDGYLSIYIDNAYAYMFLPLMIIITFRLALKYNESEIEKIHYGLQAVLWGCAFQAFVSVLLNIRGTYGGAAILNTSAVYAFLPFLFLISFYEKAKYRTANFIVAVVSSFLILEYGSTGKIFITYVLVFLIFILKMINEKKPRRLANGIILILILLFCAPLCLMYFASADKGVFTYKLYQAKQVLSIHKWNMDYIRNMENSPRVRFGELFNVLAEYLKKPWFLLTGKGYGGSVLDYTGMFALIPARSRSGSYSTAQFDNGTFVDLHEITSIMLVFGLPGFIFICKLAKYAIKTFKTNYWILIGSFWFLIFYGYSYTIGTFGMTALCFGLIQYSQTVGERMQEVCQN